MSTFATFDSDGFPSGFFDESLFGPKRVPVYGDVPEPTEDDPNPLAPIHGYEVNPLIPSDAVALSPEQYSELIENAGLRRWENGNVVVYEPPVVEQMIILPAVTLWERLTENEADQVNEAMATQPVRTQRIFTTANTFRSDHELWPLLEQMATQLFGEARAAELLVGS